MAEKKKGKTGTQSGKAEDIDARIKKLKDKYPYATGPESGTGKPYNRMLEPISNRIGRVKTAPEMTRLRNIKRKKDIDDFIKYMDENFLPETKDKAIADYERAVGRSKAQSGGMKAGGKVKAKTKPKTTRKFRGDGIARKGKTKGRFV
jgi:hypothetical protein